MKNRFAHLFSALLFAMGVSLPGGASAEPLRVARLAEFVAESISTAAEPEASDAIAREVLEELGYEVDGGGVASLQTRWRLSESGKEPPRTARRYRILTTSGSVGSMSTTPSVLVELSIEETRQVDEGGGRWVWRPWARAEPTKAERAAFAAVVTALEKRLPKPDPDAPPPMDERVQSTPRPQLAVTEPVDVAKLGITPVGLFQPSPPYPAIARNAALEGTVKLEIIVDKAGSVIDAKVTQSHPPFDESALKTVKKWRYRPVIVGGRPVSWRGEVAQRFQLH